MLTVSNSQINVTAAPGQATVRIGHDGTGIATFTGSTMNVGNPTADGADGSLIIAGQPGSTGMLTLNAGSVVNAGYVGVGATTAGPGGTGTLMLNNSTVNTTTFEIGASGLLAGNDGVINATGDVIVAGTISPGNSPGRITINCNLISLPGSLLIIDILGSTGDFSFDQLRIGNDSTFSLNNLQRRLQLPRQYRPERVRGDRRVRPGQLHPVAQPADGRGHRACRPCSRRARPGPT